MASAAAQEGRGGGGGGGGLEAGGDGGEPKRRFRCILQYDGTDFSGFQAQGFPGDIIKSNNGGTRAVPRTVQGELEVAIWNVTGRDPTSERHFQVTCAGRTDAGTHASGQVVSVDLDWKHPTRDLVRALNAVLPDDVSVASAEVVSSDFHPRFSASFRRYEYTIFNGPIRTPLLARCAWHVPEPLDVGAMHEALMHLQGGHDFSTFGTAPNGVGHCIREMMHLDVRQASPCLIIIEMKARSFLFRMVRNIVGTLRHVGNGRMTPDDMKRILEGRDRKLCKNPAPARGLVLAEVGFWGEDGGISFEEWVRTRSEEERAISLRLEGDINGTLPVGPRAAAAALAAETFAAAQEDRVDG